MLSEALFFLIQALLLFVLMRFSMTGATNELQRVLNPVMWVGLVYTAWFLFPQIFALTRGHGVIGFEDVAPSTRFAAVAGTQIYLICFLACLLVGFTFSSLLLEKTAGPAPSARLPLDAIYWTYALVAYAIGIVALYRLGDIYRAMPDGTMRSALVKTFNGRVLYALSFFGSFASAYLASHLWLKRHRLLALAAFSGYGLVAFFINARGRIMWPAAIAIVFVLAQRGKLSITKVALFGAVMLVGLSLMDPIFLSLKNNDPSRLQEALSASAIFSSLFFDRNFDGFANFMYITHYDRITETPGVLLGGGRELFMSTYFPDVYEIGVAFPTTYPGSFWIIGKMPGLIAMSLLYGIFLGTLNFGIRRIREEPLVWVYLLAITWLSAIGGDLTESIGKMLAAVFPALAWFCLRWLRNRRDEQPALIPQHLHS